MDPLKKRKLEENGAGHVADGENSFAQLTRQDARKIIERLSTDQLLDILQNAVARHADVLESVRAAADSDLSQRKLFIRGLGLETTTEGLRGVFSAYGELEEAIVILDKATGKSKGYGFVTFRHVDGALLALKEPSKKIDGRVTVTQLAAAGSSGPSSNSADVSMRKIYVANVPFDMPADRLLNLFSCYGDIEEGPLGFDKLTGKSRGFALFVFKSAEGAQAALVEPVKVIDGKNLHCKLAIDGKKGKPGPPGHDGMGHGGAGHGNVAPPPGSYGMAGGPGGAGGMGGYGGYSSGPPPMSHHMNSSLGSQGPLGAAAGGAAGYGAAGYGGPYGGYGGPGSGGYTGLGGPGMGSMGAAGGGFAGPGAGGGSYRMPPSSGYPEAGPYGLSSSAAFQGPHSQAAGTPPAPRVPLGGAYPNVPPYY